MNKRLEIEDFGYQDFILVKGSQNEVLEALKSIALDTDSKPEATASKWSPSGLLKSVLNRAPFKKTHDTEPQADDPAPFSLHKGDAILPVEMITSERGPAYNHTPEPDSPETFQDDMRLSAIDGSDWVLIEYREQIPGMSMLGFGLSLKLAERDVLYFRRCGDLICEYHNDFHVYRDGEATRRVLCHSTWPEGDIEQEWWENTLEGEISTYEPAGLYQDAGEMDLLDNDKLEEILAKLALSSQKLFSRVLTRDPILVSRRPDGIPLEPIS